MNNNAGLARTIGEILMERATGRVENPSFLCKCCGALLYNNGSHGQIPEYDCTEYYKGRIREALINAIEIYDHRPDANASEESNQTPTQKADLIIRWIDPDGTRRHLVPLSLREGDNAVVMPSISVSDIFRNTNTEGRRQGRNESAMAMYETYRQAISSIPPLSEEICYVPRRSANAGENEGNVISSIYKDTENGRRSWRINRICPECHKIIDKNAGKHPEIRIGVVGTQRQGKSALLTATMQKFIAQEIYGVHIESMSESGNSEAETFRKNYLERYKLNMAIAKTVDTAVFTYRYTVRVTAGMGTRYFNILFVDIAGELLRPDREPEFLEKYSRFMECIDCLWLCTDKFQISTLNEAPAQLGLGTQREVEALRQHGADLQEMLQTLFRNRRDIPCAILLVKSDQLNDIPPEIDQSTCINGPEKCLEEAACCRLSKALERYISEDNGNNAMVDIHRNEIKSSAYMYCSAYGHPVAKYGVGYDPEGKKILLFAPADAQDLFSEGATYSVRLHQGARMQANTVIQRHDRIECKKGQLFIGNNASSRDVLFVEIPCEDMGSNRDWSINITRANDNVGGNDDYIYLGRYGRESDCTIRYDDEMLSYRICIHPQPDQIELPLLWSLAVLGHYPTRGFKVVKPSFFRKLFCGASEEKVSVMGPDAQGISILLRRKFYRE